MVEQPLVASLPGVSGPARPLARRRELPDSRAVVGGLLVALAGLGTFAAASNSTARAGVVTVVAARDLPVGAALRADDLRTIEVDLPASVRTATFRDPAPLVGAMTLAPLGAGELLQARGLQSSGGLVPQVSFAIDRPRALNGAVRAGERVDVLATYGDGADAYTVVVAAAVPVGDVADAGASSDQVVVTLAIDDPAILLAVTTAVRTGAVTLARTGATP
jgi:Flp pilus assembly protein CpaB